MNDFNQFPNKRAQLPQCNERTALDNAVCVE